MKREISKGIKMYEKPALGNISGENPVMALAVFPTKIEGRYLGVARKIIKRKGNVDVAGFEDTSILVKVSSKDGVIWGIDGNLKIKGEEKAISEMEHEDGEFVGLEDPDIWIDDKNNDIHLYFTVAFLLPNNAGYKIYLGHASGKTLDDLIWRNLVVETASDVYNFKELCVAPINSSGLRLNLVEGKSTKNDVDYSVIAHLIAKNMNDPMKFGGISFHPINAKSGWCKEHASPAFLFPREFLSKGKYCVGLMNGRESSDRSGDVVKYNKFRPGLFLYDAETGTIPWVSDIPLFEDPDATTVTFVSDFLKVNDNEGLIYAQVNDSFIRAYSINAEEILKLLP